MSRSSSPFSRTWWRARFSGRRTCCRRWKEERRFSVEKAETGLYLIVWGFFKKLVIADNVGVIANKVFALNDPSFEILWAGVFAFAIQIYADFSAYTDIARGTSRWLGFELTRELRSSLSRAQSGRLLATLEHFVVHMVSRLRVRSRLAARGRAN